MRGMISYMRMYNYFRHESTNQKVTHTVTVQKIDHFTGNQLSGVSYVAWRANQRTFPQEENHEKLDSAR